MEYKEVLEKIGSAMLEVNNPPQLHRLDIFTPGLYTRHLRLPADCVFLTERHKSLHQFFVMYGKIHVWSEQLGWQLLEAPNVGITIPGIQRLFRTYTEVVWATAHPTDIYPVDGSKEAYKEAVSKITDQIIDRNYLKIVAEPEMEVIE